MFFRLFSTLWYRLLRRARLNPVLTGLTLFLLLSVGSLVIGLSTTFDEQGQSGPWIMWFNNASLLMGWLSIMAAWALALLAWAHRKEAATAFLGTGKEVKEAKEAFDASLILVSRNCQTEWHLRHIQPKRIEFVWTPLVKDQTNTLLDKFQNIECFESRHHSLNNEQAYDIMATKQHCLFLLRGLLDQHKRENVCVDLTAGTAIMTIAAFQAAEEMGVTSIYLLGQSATKFQARIIDDKKVDDPNEAKVIMLSDRRGGKN